MLVNVNNERVTSHVARIPVKVIVERRVEFKVELRVGNTFIQCLLFSYCQLLLLLLNLCLKGSFNDTFLT